MVLDNRIGQTLAVWESTSMSPNQSYIDMNACTYYEDPYRDHDGGFHDLVRLLIRCAAAAALLWSVQRFDGDVIGAGRITRWHVSVVIHC